MFTLEEIKTAHAKVKSGADFPTYIQEIKQLGVVHYETFVTDGHTVFKGGDNHSLQSEPKYPALLIAENSNEVQFKKELKEHQLGRTSYAEFCQACARLGVEKWVVELSQMTCIYHSKAGQVMLIETIPSV